MPIDMPNLNSWHDINIQQKLQQFVALYLAVQLLCIRAINVIEEDNLADILHVVFQCIC